MEANAKKCPVKRPASKRGFGHLTPRGLKWVQRSTLLNGRCWGFLISRGNLARIQQSWHVVGISIWEKYFFNFKHPSSPRPSIKRMVRPLQTTQMFQEGSWCASNRVLHCRFSKEVRRWRDGITCQGNEGWHAMSLYLCGAQTLTVQHFTRMCKNLVYI